jgi:hypothetical protein
MTQAFLRSLAMLLLLGFLLPHGLVAQQQEPKTPVPAKVYSDTSEGLQELVEEIVSAAAAKNSATETESIHALLLPDGSTWFTDEYGPGSAQVSRRRIEGASRS